jgi:hypothetical protein
MRIITCNNEATPWSWGNHLMGTRLVPSCDDSNKNFSRRPDVVGHTCSPSYTGDRSGEYSLRPIRVKDPMSTNKIGMVAYACDPNYVGGRDRIVVQARLSKNTRPYSKNN